MATRHRKRGASGSLPNFDPIPSGSRTSPGTGQAPNGSSSSGYPSSVPAWARPVSAASLKSQNIASSATSRSPSPAGDASANGQDLRRPHEQDPVLALSAGCQPDEVYRVTLPTWRYTLRKWLVRSLEGETPILARMQQASSAPFWDSYFIWSSIFGTHSAFMICLPMFFWFGHYEQGLALVNLLSAGVYLSSFVKDLLCVPRPYTPPVNRLSISSHGLEYGFPSTHSTNAVSISLYFGSLIWANSPTGLTMPAVAGLAVCFVYAASVVVGRLYCGMHSMVDCAAGSLLGFLIWYANLLFTPHLASFLSIPGATVPSIVVPLCLLVVSVHPEPVDDCPCFEDAIAFVAVSGGVCTGMWVRWTRDAFPVAATQGDISAFLDLGSSGNLGVQQVAIWASAALAKLVLGVACVFLWRLVVKKALQKILPPLFQLFLPIFSLPRKGYEESGAFRQPEQNPHIIPIPSILDLTELGAAGEEGSTSRSASPAIGQPTGKRQQYLNVVGTTSRRPEDTAAATRATGIKVKALAQVHYDVDVLTKVGVYSGIGYIAVVSIPLLFLFVGLDA